ncbi:MAG: hypothetical protein RLZZ234_626 [Candidatus Parcubacteria bacterium]|jgi:hypothetical protein
MVKIIFTTVAIATATVVLTTGALIVVHNHFEQKLLEVGTLQVSAPGQPQ